MHNSSVCSTSALSALVITLLLGVLQWQVSRAPFWPAFIGGEYINMSIICPSLELAAMVVACIILVCVALVLSVHL